MTRKELRNEIKECQIKFIEKSEDKPNVLVMNPDLFDTLVTLNGVEPSWVPNELLPNCHFDGAYITLDNTLAKNMIVFKRTEGDGLIEICYILKSMEVREPSIWRMIKL